MAGVSSLPNEDVFGLFLGFSLRRVFLSALRKPYALGDLQPAGLLFKAEAWLKRLAHVAGASSFSIEEACSLGTGTKRKWGGLSYGEAMC